MILLFDTETTGTPINYDAPASDVNNWPRLVQLAFIKSDWEGNIIRSSDFIIKPQGFTIPEEASKLHGITHDMALSLGSNLSDVLVILNKEIEEAGLIVAHNIRFDEKIIAAEFYRNNIKSAILDKIKLCTMKSSVDFCALPGGYNGYKWPKLSELHNKLFNEGFQEHNAKSDIFATYKCFLELERRKVIILSKTLDKIRDNKIETSVDDNTFLIPYRKGDKWGYSTSNGQIVIDCMYENASLFSEGLAAVISIEDGYHYEGEISTPLRNGYTGYINKRGEQIISLRK